VLVLEAGQDYVDHTVDIPLNFVSAALNEEISWDYWVKHYTDDTTARRDSKYYPEHGGVLYPRSSGIGGCGLHHVMNILNPANSDWEHIAHITDDHSWEPENMRLYWQRIEQNRVSPPPVTPEDEARTRRGYHGYIPVEHADYARLGRELGNYTQSLFAAIQGLPASAGYQKIVDGDYNHWENNGKVGWGYAPSETLRGRRFGVRQLLKAAQAQYPDFLTIETDALVTRILFHHDRAVGVEYYKGKHLYAAHKKYSVNNKYGVMEAYAEKEVIISAGTYNSPQILKLSGIGPRQELEKLGIDVVVDLPGVGQNLQDRYEVPLNFKLKRRNPAFACSFTFDVSTDACYARWKEYGDNFYGTNSVMYFSTFRSSGFTDTAADVALFAAPGYFLGYSPRMGVDINTVGPDAVVALVLKAFTNNNAGTVTLQSNDPRDVPLIEFHYFDEGNDEGQVDLQAVLEGIKELRRQTSSSAFRALVDGEIGTFANATTDEEIKQRIKDEAWGHHACCTNKIGAEDDEMAVVNSNFRVYGVQGLRVVDMSVFPNIPGYFPLGAIYMISEKAADAISADYPHEQYENGPEDHYLSTNAITGIVLGSFFGGVVLTVILAALLGFSPERTSDSSNYTQL
jgi:choline dehydrogenase